MIAALDLTRLGEPRAIAEPLFDVVYDVSTPTGGSGAPWRAAAPAAAEAKPLPLAGPLDEPEAAFLNTASALIGPHPRGLKRFYNAYRLARLSDAPRGALALSLAALMAPDPDLGAALGWTLCSEGELIAPSAPAPLKAAFESLGVQGMDKAAARRAFETARRFAPWA